MNRVKEKMVHFYKPKKWFIIFDIGIVLFLISTIFLFFPLTTQEPFVKYEIPLLLFVILWVFFSYIFKRYRPLRTRSFFKQIFSLFYTTTAVVFIFGVAIIIQPNSPYSEHVLLTIIVGLFITEYLVVFLYFAYKYATQYDLPEVLLESRINAIAQSSELLSKDAVKERKNRIIENNGIGAFRFLEQYIRWNETGTLLLKEAKIGDLSNLDQYQYHTIVLQKALNNMRGINKMLLIINDKLPDDGIFVCHFKPLEIITKQKFHHNSKFVNSILRSSYFLYHRIFPKFFLTKRLYYDITGGKKRILSETEVLGRLYYAGFSIVEKRQIGTHYFVIVQREKNAIIEGRRNYGMLIKLKRIGKNGKLFNVYKLRTMYPYAEFIQEYVYRQNALAEGGKFENDMRISGFGAFLRKFWLDETPMLWNLAKGNMKLVGVRPLSSHYFSLYSEELQEKRIKFKPGLLPPFYADMPKTLDEIQASETKYLIECEKKGVLRTDTRYFFLILKNILFKKARSA